ncbi:hypothetical protein N7449_011200 [Penicillium cf. viridicatum]|uniref:Uncharacterized protein n=1 Tax=Penicillium cf. viridicatum TaxID=2972119 RepID=A0A9W9J2P7_9EURO|nr:hypothetical protein N7449_011200 [Penicillium cf. viridicatum]
MPDLASGGHFGEVVSGIYWSTFPNLDFHPTNVMNLETRFKDENLSSSSENRQRKPRIAWPISSYMKSTFNKGDGEVLKAEVPVSLRGLSDV